MEETNEKSDPYERFLWFCRFLTNVLTYGAWHTTRSCPLLPYVGLGSGVDTRSAAAGREGDVCVSAVRLLSDAGGERVGRSVSVM